MLHTNIITTPGGGARGNASYFRYQTLWRAHIVSRNYNRNFVVPDTSHEHRKTLNFFCVRKNFVLFKHPDPLPPSLSTTATNGIATISAAGRLFHLAVIATELSLDSCIPIKYSSKHVFIPLHSPSQSG